MKKALYLAHQFVHYIPATLEIGTLYISINFATVAHKCCCGCGFEVITPLSPKDWKLTYDGESISLEPSIGNWSFPCQSHYWIRRSAVKWVPQWYRTKLEEGRTDNRLANKSPAHSEKRSTEEKDKIPGRRANGKGLNRSRNDDL